MRDPKRVFCAADVRRVVEIPLSPPRDPDRARREVDAALAWYNEHEFRRLTLCFSRRAAGAEGAGAFWDEALELAARARAAKAPAKSDPQCCFLLPVPSIDAAGLDRLEGVDVRVPRAILFGAHEVTAEHDDLEPVVERLAELVQRRPLAVRLFLTARSAVGIAALEAALERLEARGGPAARFVAGAFPVVEVPAAAADADPGTVAGALLRLWCRFPRLDESVGMSVGGLMPDFFAAREAWYLGEVLNGRARARPAGTPFAAAVRERLTHEAYQRMTTLPKSAVLEHDVDLLSDSHECQSPVFVNNRWLLKKQRSV